MENKQLVSPATIVSVEEKNANYDNFDKYYLILLVFNEEEHGEQRDWVVKRGRKETYDLLKDYIQNEPSFDAVASKILVNGNTLGDELCVAKFMSIMQLRFDKNSEFNIDNYVEPEEYDVEDANILPEE